MYQIAFIELEELESTPRTPPLFLCQSVIRIALVLRGFAHGIRELVADFRMIREQ